MKKTLLLLSIIIAVAMIFTGCSSKDEQKSEIIHIETTIEAAGSYHIFQTQDVQSYLSFLESFDDTKYEIVDISTSLNAPDMVYGSDEFYMITYKNISK